jgi:hypothetical protein
MSPVRILRDSGLCLVFFLSVSTCFATTRHYYIAAEDVTWSYAPSGMNLFRAVPLNQQIRLHLQWPKTRFIEYTDDTYTTKKPQPDWLGILGPVIRAEVGDEVVVDFLNRTRFAHDMHPHGLRYDKNNEGSFYIPFGRGDRVAPGRKFTYHWFANAASGPGPDQPSSIVWWYHAHVEPGIEINAGLIGPIVVTAKGKAKPDGSPKDVDREFVTSFQIFDQMGGKPEGLFYSINGYIFGNLPGLYMKRGDKVRWYLLAMGNEIDLHTPHWHGETVAEGGRHVDVVELLPGSMKTVDMIADNPGSWMFHCHVDDHMEGGMMALYTIYEPAKRACPVKFGAGDFWQDPEKATLEVKNISGKAIANMSLNSEMFLAPQDLRQTHGGPWVSSKPMAPGEQQTLEKPWVRSPGTQAVIGWVFLPSSIKFQDGSTWHPEISDECFGVIWREPQHPDTPALPPLQIEINPD